jgi:hypothetical protein
MGDLLIALSVIAYAFVLYHKWQAGRARKRLLKLLEAQNAGVPAAAGEDAGAPR